MSGGPAMPDHDVEVLVSRVHYPVTTLGPGVRAGIWFQGCTIRCPRCIAVDTWRPHPTNAVPLGEVLAWFDALPNDVEGVTVSGGEPTEQPEALAALLRALDARRVRPGRPDLDVIVFTGREPEWVQGEGRAQFTGADAVMAGPYVESLAGTSPLRGSENQRLLLLSPLGEARFVEDRMPPRERMQVESVGGQLWMIGIPLPDVMADVTRRAEEAGLVLRGRSWSR